MVGNKMIKKLNRHVLHGNYRSAITTAGQSKLVDNIFQIVQHENIQCSLIVKNIKILGTKSFSQVFHI